MKRVTILADVGMLITTVIWGYGFIATRFAIDNYTANQIMLYRFAVAAIIMLVVSRGKFGKITKKDIINCASLGFFLYMGFVLQTTALNYTTVSKNAFLTTLNTLFVPLIAAAVHKKRIDGYSAAGCLLALAGSGILSLNMDFSMNFGDFLTILCAISFSFHIFYQGVFVKQTNTMLLVTGQLFFTAVFSAFSSAVTGDLLITHFDSLSIFGILYLAVMSTCVCLFLQAVCQRYTSEVKTVVIFTMEAVFASIFAVIILHEPVTARFLIGSGTIITAVIVSTTKLNFLRRQCEVE